MRLPKTLTIENITYPVSGLPHSERIKGAVGMMYPEREGAEIQVSRKLSDRQQILTLLHEICHAVLDPLKLNSRHEERIVIRLEEGLASALEENPTFFRNLITRLRQNRKATRPR